MKSRILILMLVCFFGLSMAKASEPSIMVKKVLTEKVTYPQQAQDLMIEGNVEVKFSIDNAGKVIVKEAKSNNELLKDDVVKQLKKITLEPDSAYKDNTYSIRFNFELIK